MPETAGLPVALVIDANPITRASLRSLLGQEFHVETANSGAAALAFCAASRPSVILMAIPLPDEDGFELCRTLSETSKCPLVFVADDVSADEAVMALDAGGDDVVVKPVTREVLFRRIGVARKRHEAATALRAEKDSLHSMAMTLLSSVGESGALLNFTRTALGCRGYHDLAAALVASAGELGMLCLVRVLGGDGSETTLGPNGPATPFEASAMAKLTTMGRIFQFKSRLIVNYDRVSVLVTNMPSEADNAELAGRMRDNCSILAETAEGLVDNVQMRIESVQRAEQLQVALGSGVLAIEEMRAQFLGTLTDVGQQLHELVSEVERTFSWLSIGQEGEQQISNTLNMKVELIMRRLSEGADFEDKFEHVMSALRGGGGSSQGSVELF